MDGWGHTFRVSSTRTGYKIYSQGKDGTGDDCAAGQTSTFNDQICFVDGQFVRYPEGAHQ